MQGTQDMHDINDQDKLMAALSWVIPVVGLIVLLVEDMRNRPFQKYHAVSSLAFFVALIVLVIGGSILITIITIFTAGFGSFLSCCLCIPWLVTLYWAFEAYQGKYVTIPGLTDFLKGQGWI